MNKIINSSGVYDINAFNSISNKTTIFSFLNVSGTTTWKNVIINGSLNSSNTLNSNTTINGTLNVSGFTTLNNITTINSSLNVSGTTNLSAGNITGKILMSGTVVNDHSLQVKNPNYTAP